MLKHKHKWEWLGETRESCWECCEDCGAVKRTRAGVKVFLSKLYKASRGKLDT